MTGGERAVAIGWDMTAALALAAALGIPARLAAEMLPPIEAAVTGVLNAPEGSYDPEADEVSDD